jgi:hypothetical protein
MGLIRSTPRGLAGTFGTGAGRTAAEARFQPTVKRISPSLPFDSPGPQSNVCDCPRRGTHDMKKKIARAQEGHLTKELAVLQKLTIAELKERWCLLYGNDPPRRISRELLIRAIAYRLQERVFGGLKPATRRMLERLGGDLAARLPMRMAPRRKHGSGTVLIREWRGTSHRVTVVDRGAIYRGKRYGSLSEVARVITGTRWSGPLFFGLRSPAKEVSNGAR